MFHIPKEKIKDYEPINSIDKAAAVYSESRTRREYSDEIRCLVSPEQEFWGHCSNMQVWYDYDYDPK